LARSCFKARKSSHFLKDLNSSMSSVRHRAFSKHSPTKPELPFVGSLRLASSRTGLPELRVKMDLQMEDFFGWFPSTSLEVPVDVDFFDCPFSIQSSFAGGWWEDCVISHSSVPSALLPPWAFFIFYFFLFVRDISRRRVYGSRGGWLGHHRHN